MRKNTRKPKGTLFLAFLLVALVLGVMVARKYQTATRKPAPSVQERGGAVVALYFGAADGNGLAREGREVEIGENVEENIEEVVDELISGPVGSLAPTLPAQTRVLAVRVKGDVAEIDFGRELRDDLPAGSSAETAAVYSVVDTVAGNFPKVKSVQFLIEGAVPDSLKGHFDLRKPVAPDFVK